MQLHEKIIEVILEHHILTDEYVNPHFLIELRDTIGSYYYKTDAVKLDEISDYAGEMWER